MSALGDAVIRLKAALEQKPRGFRGPAAEQLHVAMTAGDLLEIATAARVKTFIDGATESSRTRAGTRAEVVIQVDDAYLLLDLSNGKPDAKSARPDIGPPL